LLAKSPDAERVAVLTSLIEAQQGKRVAEQKVTELQKAVKDRKANDPEFKKMIEDLIEKIKD
jgi:hypothetical protein